MMTSISAYFAERTDDLLVVVAMDLMGEQFSEFGVALKWRHWILNLMSVSVVMLNSLDTFERQRSRVKEGF